MLVGGHRGICRVCKGAGRAVQPLLLTLQLLLWLVKQTANSKVTDQSPSRAFGGVISYRS